MKTQKCKVVSLELGRNAKRRNGKFLDHNSTRQSHSRSINNHRNNPPQVQQCTAQHCNDEDFEALLNDDDDDFLAELDGDMNPVVNGHPTEPDDHDDFEALLNDDDDDFLAELDGNMNPVEVNGHPAEPDDHEDFEALMNDDDDFLAELGGDMTS